MAVISLDPTNPENYLQGQGEVFFQPEGSGGTIEDYNVGNCTAFEITPAQEKVQHKSRMTPTRVTDRTDTVEATLNVRVVMEAWTPRNLQMMLIGTPNIADLANVSIPILSADSVRGHLKFVGTNTRGPQWTFDLPVVEFSPSGSLDPLQDEYGNMEVTAEVIYDGGFGTAEADFSAGSAVPTNTIPPTVYGTARVGFTLTALKGTWTGYPTTYAYQWQHDAGAGYVDIAGKTASTYVVVVGSLGFPVRVKVTATNSVGPNAGTITSAPTADVIAA